MKFSYRGFLAPVFTPFNDDHTLNLEVIPKYAEYLAENGIRGVMILGTSGEGVSMSIVEKKTLLDAWVQAVKITKQHLLVQIAGCPLPDVLELGRYAEKVGVDSIIAFPELYFKPAEPKDLVRYLKCIAEVAPNTPLLYNHMPECTSVQINMLDFLNEAVDQLPTLAGIKYSSNELDIALDTYRIYKNRYTIFFGNDFLMASAFAMGMESAIVTTINFFPKQFIAMKKLFEDSRIEEAKEMQNQISTAIGIILKDGKWVATMKAAMNLLSPISCGPARAPLVNLTAQETARMKNSFATMGLNV